MSRQVVMRDRQAGHAPTGLAQLLLRGVLAGTMIAHGLRHARTLDGTSGWFRSIGFRQPRLQAQLSAAVEVGAGTALAGGVATPLAASAVVGTMWPSPTVRCISPTGTSSPPRAGSMWGSLVPPPSRWPRWARGSSAWIAYSAWMAPGNRGSEPRWRLAWASAARWHSSLLSGNGRSPRPRSRHRLPTAREGLVA